jgi:lipopolysaccharide transport system ATP-binding protein
LTPAIRTENLSKIYRLGEIGTGTISRDLERWWAKMRGKEDPFLKIGQANDRALKGESDIVYSLRDINFEIQQGEAVGIIGKNGAGKSTLLKILSRVTSPTTGKIEIKGRIASLLEVGTGFHPELTGRENIYLNGAILGMRKKEITRKLDEIINFSGVERYIDTPVKRYSSGMYVRLAFAVAAHLESEILIVDEVLAVGDAEFQKKCLGKMGDVSKNDGRTVLFVSHNMTSIQKLCTNSILLENGIVSNLGKTNEVINYYLNKSVLNNSTYIFNSNLSRYKTINFKKLIIEDIDGNSVNSIPIGKAWRAKIHFLVKESLTGIIIGLGISNDLGFAIKTSWSPPQEFTPGEYIAYFVENLINLNPGTYSLNIGISKGFKTIDYIDTDIFLVISNIVFHQEESIISNNHGIINNQMKIKIKKIT